MLSLLAVLVFQSKFLDLGLTLRAGLPTGLRTFVSSYMDIFIREELTYFCQDIFQESIYSLISCTEHIVGNAPARPDFIRAAGTSQLGICSQGGKHMSREVNLRNDIYTLGRSIGYNLADLILSVPESFSIWNSVVRMEILSDACTLSDGADFCQTRILLDLDSPSLVLGEMPVELV